MMQFDMSGKTALVTGGASGIGLATTELFARNGATVAVNHLPSDGSALETIAGLRDSGHAVIAAPGDVSDPEQAASMVESAIAQLGRLDVLVNNAGTANAKQPIAFDDLDAMDESFWQTILSTNLVGAFRCARASVPALRESQGVIINTASVAGLGTRGSSLAYGASKAALINLTRNLAKALAPTVRVNAVAPGLVRTPWTDPWPEERKQATLQRSLLKRLVEPSDVAAAIAFLAVQTAITGEVLVVDCGSSIS